MENASHLGERNLARLRKLSTAQQPTTLHETATTLENSAKNNESVRDALLTCLGTLSHTPATAADDDTRVTALARLRKSATTGLRGTAIAEDVEGQALTAEAALACLLELQTKWKVEMDNESLRHILAYTDAEDGWTTKEAAAMTGWLVDAALPEHKVSSFTVESILQQHLRPLFSQSTTKVTASGRPVLFEQGEPSAYRGLETPLWKRGGLQIISLFRWAVQNADENVIRDHWPLFTPVLLTLIEDEDTAVRVHGLGTLGAFVDKCPLRILATTGISKVFEESVFPSLLFLPTLTPEDQSVEIIKAAYKVLLMLAKKDPDTQSSARRHLLDKMLRNGVFAAHDHASQYMRIVETLMITLISVVDALEIFAVKHLQNLLPLLSAVMTDPFAPSRPATLLAAAQAMNAVLANCWPRISEGGYDDEVIRIVSTCWTNLHDHDAAALDSSPLERELRCTISAVLAVQRSRNLGADRTVSHEDIEKAEPELKTLWR